MIELLKLAETHLKYAIDSFIGAYVMYTLENDVNPDVASDTGENRRLIELMYDRSTALNKLLTIMNLATLYRPDLECECHPVRESWCTYCDLSDKLKNWIEEYGEKSKDPTNS